MERMIARNGFEAIARGKRFERSRRMHRIVIRSILLAAMSVVVQAKASPSAATPTMEQANQTYFAKNWSAAAQAFEAITRTQPTNALDWLRLGVSRHKLERFAEAVEAYKHAESDPQIGTSALYREAAS